MCISAAPLPFVNAAPSGASGVSWRYGSSYVIPPLNWNRYSLLLGELNVILL